MRALVSSLTANHSLATCEAAFVEAFIVEAKLHVGRNIALMELRDTAPDDTAEATCVIRQARRVSFEDLIVGFELLIPADERRRDGAVFTPRPIADYLALRTVDADTSSILDPSCGCGALLLSAARRAAVVTDRGLADIATHMLHGVDLRAANVRRARILLGLLCADAGVDAPDAGAGLRVANSLTFPYEDAFPDVADAGGFDAILGNPPYVRFQDMDAATREQLAAWPGGGSGNPNLYFAFFPLGYRLLAPSGRLAYISPNSFFHLRSARGLREWFNATGFIGEVIDFRETLVFEALAYTAITICRRDGAGYVTYRVETNPARLADVEHGEQVDADDLTTERWRFRVGPTGRLLNRLETRATVRVGDIATVRGGVATLRDRLFFVDAPDGADVLAREHEGRTYRIERAATRPCVRVSDFTDAEALAGNTRRIIYPYAPNTAGRPQVLPEVELRERFPGAYAYLCAIRPELERRDRGTKVYPAWFAYGRSQGLVATGPALLAPLYGRDPRFLKETTPERLFCNGQALVMRNDAPTPWSLELLGAFLHRSPVVAFIMTNTANKISGGYWQYSRTLMGALPLPALTDDEAAAILGADDESRPGLIQGAYRLSPAERNQLEL